MTIVVGYKTSDAANAALDFGLELAAKLSMRVVVVNAGPGAENRSETELTRSEHERLEQYLADASVPTEVRQYARGRSTVDEFQDVAAELKPYLVVIGAARRSGFRKFVMGSVANELLEELAVPVVSVKVPEGPVVSNSEE